MSESLSGRSRASMDTAAVAPGWGEPSGATLCVRRGTGECHQRLVQSWKATKKKSKSAVSNLLRSAEEPDRIDHRHETDKRWT